MQTLKDFCEQSSIAPELIRAVVRQMGGWSDFQEHAHDVAQYGADMGVPGFIYYNETWKFYAKNQESVVALAQRMAEEQGMEVIAMVWSFNCLRGEHDSGEIGATLYGKHAKHCVGVANALAWFALEEVARDYCAICEEC